MKILQAVLEIWSGHDLGQTDRWMDRHPGQKQYISPVRGRHNESVSGRQAFSLNLSSTQAL